MRVPFAAVMVGGPMCGRRLMIQGQAVTWPVRGPGGLEFWRYRVEKPLPDGSGFYCLAEAVELPNGEVRAL